MRRRAMASRPVFHNSYRRRSVLSQKPGSCSRARGARTPRETRGTLSGNRRSAQLLPQVVRPGWALIGDAGYHKDPFLATGISDMPSAMQSCWSRRSTPASAGARLWTRRLPGTRKPTTARHCRSMSKPAARLRLCHRHHRSCTFARRCAATRQPPISSMGSGLVPCPPQHFTHPTTCSASWLALLDTVHCCVQPAPCSGMRTPCAGCIRGWAIRSWWGAGCTL
jgi:hypothetical protein